MTEHSLHTFSAPTMRDALNLVRTQLGADALIVDQSEFPGGVLVRAQVEPAPDNPQSTSRSEIDPGATPRDTPDAERSRTIDVSEDTEFATHLEAELRSQAQSVRSDLNSLLNFAPSSTSISQLSGVYRFVGASGVGKTSLLIKVLVEWVMHNGSDDVLVIASDKQRLGASEPLQLTTQLLGVTLKETRQSGLRELLARYADTRLVLIDCCASELEDVKQLTQVQDVLVLSALHATYSVKAQIAPWLGQQSWLAVTHTDQPFAGRSFFTALGDLDAQLMWLGTSAYVPGGIEVATQEQVMRLVELTDGIEELCL